MNMTGDPNQQNGANLFGVNYNFTLAANPVDWTKFPNQPVTASNIMDTPQFPNAVNSGAAYLQEGPVGFSHPIPLNFTQQNVPNPVDPVSFPPPSAPLTNYCFGAGDNRPQAAPVQFPFPIASTSTAGGEFGSRSLHIPLRCKRKTDSPPPPATKQHITDEKMAEHMAQLHINSETVTSMVEPEPQPAREKRLYMCEEMRKLQQESILPQALLNRISRPCTAVVLWTPPQRLHIPLPATANENNNEEDQPDNNVMDLDAIN